MKKSEKQPLTWKKLLCLSAALVTAVAACNATPSRVPDINSIIPTPFTDINQPISTPPPVPEPTPTPSNAETQLQVMQPTLLSDKESPAMWLTAGFNYLIKILPTLEKNPGPRLADAYNLQFETLEGDLANPTINEIVKAMVSEYQNGQIEIKKSADSNFTGINSDAIYEKINGKTTRTKIIFYVGDKTTNNSISDIDIAILLLNNYSYWRQIKLHMRTDQVRANSYAVSYFLRHYLYESARLTVPDRLLDIYQQFETNVLETQNASNANWISYIDQGSRAIDPKYASLDKYYDYCPPPSSSPDGTSAPTENITVINHGTSVEEFDKLSISANDFITLGKKKSSALNFIIVPVGFPTGNKQELEKALSSNLEVLNRVFKDVPINFYGLTISVPVNVERNDNNGEVYLAKLSCKSCDLEKYGFEILLKKIKAVLPYVYKNLAFLVNSSIDFGFKYSEYSISSDAYPETLPHEIAHFILPDEYQSTSYGQHPNKLQQTGLFTSTATLNSRAFSIVEKLSPPAFQVGHCGDWPVYRWYDPLLPNLMGDNGDKNFKLALLENAPVFNPIQIESMRQKVAEILTEKK